MGKRKIALFLCSCMLAVTWSVTAGATTATEDISALHLSKTASAGENGIYNLTLEAYTTGMVISSTRVQPMDIVLVLDQSGSMLDPFGLEGSRNEAMKKAAKEFINAVAQNSSKHKVALVEFDSGARMLKDLTIMNSDGKKHLKSEISQLSPDGATRVDLGLKKATQILPKSDTTGRKQMVIVLTDGYPTNYDGFQTWVADDAIFQAKGLKDGGVEIYTVGIFKNADPNQISGSDTVIGSKWSGTNNDPAANRFMNFMSSNSTEASDLGLKYNDLETGDEWEILKKYGWDNQGYYLEASNAKELSNVFESISENIVKPSISLDSTTVLKDFIYHDFQFPKGASIDDIKVQEAEIRSDANLDNLTSASWKESVDRNDLNVTLDTDLGIISVTGFDYDANIVVDQNGSVTGKKLIVTIPIEVAPSCIGGGEIPTNTEQSAIYDAEENMIKPFDIPEVYIPLQSKDLIICKHGIEDMDENQSVVFHIRGVDDTPTADVDMTVVMNEDDNWEMVIKDLPAGQYQIKEDEDWSWRYEAKEDAATQKITLSDTTKVEFYNERETDKWLNGSAWCNNQWLDNGIIPEKGEE